MAIQRISQRGAVTVQPIGAIGTYTLAVPLQPGFYRITTDTTQNLSATQLLFRTTSGFSFGAAVRGGQGYLAVPVTVDQVQFTAGTFPLLLGMERIGTYTLIDAPTVTNADVSWTPGTSVTFDLTFTLPPTATGIGIYWANGTFTDLLTTTSPRTGITPPTTPTFGSPYPFMVVAKDANGVFGLGQVLNPVYNFQVFTSNGTYTPPSWSTTADVWVIAGGGGGGANNFSGSGGNKEGGGGAGGYRAFTAVPTTGPVTVTVGAGGAGGAGGFNPSNQGGDGGASRFDSATYESAGGGGGGAYRSTGALVGPGRPGGSGGGGGTTATGGHPGGAGNTPATSPPQGFNGGTSTNGTHPGAGGGAGGPGGDSTASADGVPGPGVTLFGVTYAAGANSATFSSTRGSGGRGANASVASGAAGVGGIVIVKANGTP
jgi:hypothetical protein